MYLNAGASQRAQGRSPGSGGRGTHRRGVAPRRRGQPASRPQEAGGWPHSPHRNTYGDSLGAEAGLYILSGMSGQGWGRRSARVVASSAHSGRSSDCGAAWVGIVYVCAARPREVTSIWEVAECDMEPKITHPQPLQITSYHL